VNEPRRPSGLRSQGPGHYFFVLEGLAFLAVSPIYRTMAKTESKQTIVARRPQGDRIHQLIRSRIRQYPYLAIATGAGLAWVLAGGLTARKTSRVLGAIGGLALFSPIWSRLIGLGASLVDPRTS
jgi:hypothetical protein